MSDNGAFEVERTTAIELSRIGRARRDQMLHELQGVMTIRRRRRKVVRVGACTAAGLLIAIATWRLVAPAPSETIEPPPSPVAADPVRAPSGSIPPVPPVRFDNMQFERVGDDPTVLQRFACEPMPADHVERITDRELIELLAQDHRPTGLIRVPAPPAPAGEKLALVILTAIPHDDSSEQVPLDQLPEVAANDPAG